MLKLSPSPVLVLEKRTIPGKSTASKYFIKVSRECFTDLTYFVVVTNTKYISVSFDHSFKLEHVTIRGFMIIFMMIIFLAQERLSN